MSRSGEKQLVCPVDTCSHGEGGHEVLGSLQLMLCPTLQNPHMTERLKTQAALIQRGWDRSEWGFTSQTCQMSPWGFAMGSWDGARLSRWHWGLIQAQFPWQTGNSLGGWDHTAGPVPLQQMPRGKLASHSQPGPQVTLASSNCIYSAQSCVHGWKCGYHGCAHRGNNPKQRFWKIFRSGIFDLMRERGAIRHNAPTDHSSHCEEAQWDGDASKNLSPEDTTTGWNPANSTFLWRETQGGETFHQFCVFIFAVGIHWVAVQGFEGNRSCWYSWASCSAWALSLENIPGGVKQANHNWAVSICSKHSQNQFVSACRTFWSSSGGLVCRGATHSQLPLRWSCNAAQITLLCLSFLIPNTINPILHSLGVHGVMQILFMVMGTWALFGGLGVPICHHLEKTGINLHVGNAECCYCSQTNRTTSSQNQK